MLHPSAALRLVKTLHTIVWAVFAGAILAIPVLAWREQWFAAAALIALVLVECLVLVANGMRCPLTGVAARYTDDRRDNFDIYLPVWLARHNKLIFGWLFPAGLLFTLARWWPAGDANAERRHLVEHEVILVLQGTALLGAAAAAYARRKRTGIPPAPATLDPPRSSMPTTTFDSPESAAMSDFPAAHCRVVASAVEGDDGYVLLDTSPGESGYLYGVAVHREEGGWSPGTSGNGPGWTSTDVERDLGTLAAWGSAPAGADRVRVRWGGHAGEAPVADGAYLVAWWRVPCPDPIWPAVEFRVRGEWVPGSPG